MTTQYGVWSTFDGGFISTGAWSTSEAEADRLALIEQAAPEDRAEAADDLRVSAICPDHDEQPADACKVCAPDPTTRPD